MDTTIFQFIKATLLRDGQVFIKDFSFQVTKGSHLAIIGPSGSGKSSLLEAIRRRSYIAGGEINHPFLDHVAVSKRDLIPDFSYRDLISIVPTKHSFKDLSNTSNLYYQQRYNSADSESVETVDDHLMKLHSESQSVEWTLERLKEKLNLKALAGKQLIKLSNGEAKRLLLASALIKDPLLLLLDHPLTGLDPKTRASFNDFLTEISLSGITVVMTTTPNEIPEIITDVAVIANQEIQLFSRKEFDPTFYLPNPITNPDKKRMKELVSVIEHQYESIVAMDHVNIQYEDEVILKDVSWKVNQGERWLLKGHNGAGKSTLLSLINADNPQSYSKDVTLFDRKRGSGESIWDIKRKIGFVSAELYQYFSGNTTCSGVIESGFYETMGLFRPSKVENRAIALSWMKLFKIEGSSNKLFKNASESIQRLCLLARAMVKNPPLLILDEPCQGLDIDQQKNFKVIIETICGMTNITVIYVSHFQEDVPDCLTHVMELKNGKVIFSGTEQKI